MGKPRKKVTTSPARAKRAATARAADRREAAFLIRQVADTRGVEEDVRTVIARVAQLLDWDRSRAEDVWRGEARRIDAYEMQELRDHSRVIIRRRD